MQILEGAADPTEMFPLLAARFGGADAVAASSLQGEIVGSFAKLAVTHVALLSLAAS
ncbi:hypothetical protein SAMD00023353_0102310 [Rosellinia necatrix]|uniref:Uncharacterized protein n=1 Tax=Rosellinia necatrix TaxID=77044 RepID=A0A1S8A4Z5_ROSNE|nr:hypothetical protein SAMD00023353_0102310 [Rosellinia necatrix]